MNDIFKCYLFVGALIAMVSKFPLYSWQNFLIMICFSLIMAVFRRSVETKQSHESLKYYIKTLRDMGYYKDADKIEALLPESEWEELY